MPALTKVVPVANIKSQIKRNRTNEKARQRNKAVKSSLKTSVRKFNTAVDAGDKDQAREDTITVTRTNHVAPKGAIAGSDFAVSVAQNLDVVIAPNPNLP